MRFPAPLLGRGGSGRLAKAHAAVKKYQELGMYGTFNALEALFDIQTYKVGHFAPTEGSFVANAKQIERAESVFQRYERREAEINDALKQEAARHAAVVKNMGRLRALRLSRNENGNAAQGRSSTVGTVGKQPAKLRRRVARMRACNLLPC